MSRTFQDAETSPPILIEAIYGWGWMIDGSLRFEPPANFRVRFGERIDGGYSGLVDQAGHEFDGRRVEVRQKNPSWQGDANINVTITVLAASAHPAISAGDGVLTERPRL